MAVYYQLAHFSKERCIIANVIMVAFFRCTPSCNFVRNRHLHNIFDLLISAEFHLPVFLVAIARNYLYRCTNVYSN